jgi:predicted nucleotidyltransferase
VTATVRQAPTIDELRRRRDEILAIAARRGARSIRVFGSVARGDASVGSDVDFLVEMAPDRTVLDLSELILDLEEALGRRVDVVEIRSPSEVAREIERQAQPL